MENANPPARLRELTVSRECGMRGSARAYLVEQVLALLRRPLVKFADHRQLALRDQFSALHGVPGDGSAQDGVVGERGHHRLLLFLHDGLLVDLELLLLALHLFFSI